MPNLNTITSWARAAGLRVPGGLPPAFRLPGRSLLADRIVAVPFERA